MPFARPTLTELRNQAIQDITTSGVPGLTGLLRNAVLRVLAWCMAGLAFGVYGYADWIARMGVPFAAENEFLYAWAGLIGIYPEPATPAQGTAQFTGVPGTVLPAGTVLGRGDGTEYTTTADGTVDATGIVVVPFISTAFGEFTNADTGTVISIRNPIIGINSGGVTVGATFGGADAEEDEALRSRMLFKYREPPQGGAFNDYVEWAREVPGCTRAWCLPMGMGVGSVLVWVMFDGNDNNGLPIGTDGVSHLETRGAAAVATGDQGLVADHIFPVQPVTALVYVAAPPLYPINVTIAQLTPNNQANRDLAAAAIADMLFIEGYPGATIWPSQIYDAVLTVPGITHFTIIEPAIAITMPTGYLPVMGTLYAPDLHIADDAGETEPA